jgi:nucleotide-binding universal stress UspA family protein
MYKRILIATDGSRLSRKALAQGIALAKAHRAAVVGFHARPPFPPIYYGEPIMISPRAEKEYDRRTVRAAERYLGEIAAAAKRAGLRFKGVHRLAFSPADGVIEAARKEKCELIVMASHGRRGISRVLLGSETNKVLVRSHIPVLVTR